MNAIKSVLSIDNTKKRNTLVSDLISGMFKVELTFVMNEAKELIERKNYHAKDKFPFDNKELKEAVAIVVENMAFLCEFALRFPSIVNKRYSTDYKFKTVVQWSYQFTEETDLFDENSMKLLNLCGQQLNFIPRDENFVNPYDKKQIKEDIEREAVKKIDEARMKKMEQKKFEKHKKLKKPTLSRTEL
ncbi:unnamed protein product [Anisakis simplex]|uniref:Uncharacterized protein n=1 Tax=Anisakis simplex TaxID=6269 RepID=A0A3P6SY07_ANISI|nr:unnamed protein product [Anisakis simplex]